MSLNVCLCLKLCRGNLKTVSCTPYQDVFRRLSGSYFRNTQLDMQVFPDFLFLNRYCIYTFSWDSMLGLVKKNQQTVKSYTTCLNICVIIMFLTFQLYVYIRCLSKHNHWLTSRAHFMHRLATTKTRLDCRISNKISRFCFLSTFECDLLLTRRRHEKHSV